MDANLWLHYVKSYDYNWSIYVVFRSYTNMYYIYNNMLWNQYYSVLFLVCICKNLN